MKCPRCAQTIYRTAPECPHCGFSLSVADEKFELPNSPLRRINDLAGILRQKDRNCLEDQLNHFSKKFPQISLIIGTISLKKTDALPQYGFWLLNRGNFNHENDSQIFRVLILLDPESKSATITYAYGLEDFLNDSNTFACLADGHAFWLEERYTEGLSMCLKKLTKILKKYGKKSKSKNLSTDEVR